jgi:hypothetical protein
MDPNRTKQDFNNIPIEELPSLDFENQVIFEERGKISRDKGIIKDCYVCLRPGNKQGVPKVYIDEISKDRIIANNYGHGGIGWSTMWGSVLKAIEFAEDKLKSNDPNDTLFNKKIAVIGTGTNGCGTILKLIERGVDPRNIEVFTDNMDDSTSHRSGAILSTASILDPINPHLEKLYDDINVNTFVNWDNIEKGILFPKLKEGVQRVKAYFGAEKEWGTIVTDSGLDMFVQKGLIPQPELVYLKFKNRLNLMRKYESFYFNTFKLMRAYHDIIKNDYGIKIHMGKLKSFSEIDSSFNLIFNCSALGNNDLLKQDEDIHPIAGHIVTLQHQNMKKFDYIIYSHYIYEEDKDKGIPFHEAPLFYFMLKTDDVTFGGLLGGSFHPNYIGGDDELDEREYRGVMRRTYEIFGEDSEKFK